MHIEGMAADIVISGVNGKALWEGLREKNCCGVGWYGGTSIHVDVGPARFWTGKTAKTDTDISDHNKRIAAWTDYDVYHLGDTLILDIVRITEVPFGIKESMELISAHEGPQGGSFTISPHFNHIKSPAIDGCRMIKDRAEARRLTWALPEQASRKFTRRYKIRLQLCQRPHPDMPESIESNVFQVRP